MEKRVSSGSDAKHSLVRAFVAVPISEVAARELESFLNTLKKMASLRWVTQAQFHITLRFLGEQTQAIIDQVRAVLAHLQFSPFDIELSYAGAFPDLKRPRVLWLSGRQGMRELTALAESLSKSLAEIGLAPEKRVFKPHLTLARTNGLPLPPQLCVALKHAPTLLWRCDNVDLMRSKLTPHGAVYSKIPLS